MPAIQTYLRLDSVRARARPADFRLGKTLAAQGDIEIIERAGDHILARAGRQTGILQRRSVELRATSAGLNWRCTCTRKANHFCKHCVATALAAIA
jgi:uncharacterized Zn finger protein